MVVPTNGMDYPALTGNEHVFAYMANEAGTGSDPYLAITTQVPGFAGMFYRRV